MFYIFSQCLFNKYCLKTYCGPGIVTLSAEDTLIKKKLIILLSWIIRSSDNGSICSVRSWEVVWRELGSRTYSFERGTRQGTLVLSASVSSSKQGDHTLLRKVLWRLNEITLTYSHLHVQHHEWQLLPMLLWRGPHTLSFLSPHSLSPGTHFLCAEGPHSPHLPRPAAFLESETGGICQSRLRVISGKEELLLERQSLPLTYTESAG